MSSPAGPLLGLDGRILRFDVDGVLLSLRGRLRDAGLRGQLLRTLRSVHAGAGVATADHAAAASPPATADANLDRHGGGSSARADGGEAGPPETGATATGALAAGGW